MRSTRTRLLAAAPVAALSALLALGGGPATSAAAPQSAPAPVKPVGVKVMTQNLYLGASLDPAIEAEGDSVKLLQAVAGIYRTAMASDFPRRAEALADTIAEERPLLLGLQEVSRWTAGRVKGEGPALEQVDFLAVLKAELAERGLDYKIKGVSDNASIAAPLLAPDLGCEVRSAADFDCFARLEDRDVILVDKSVPGFRLTGEPVSGAYTAQQTFDGGPLGEISFDRGWVYLDATYLGRQIRFANTHLEVEGYREVQEAQAAEFLAGPAKVGADRQLIVTGDFNDAADPATTNQPTDTYELLTARLVDTWLEVNPEDENGWTCCQNATLTNPTEELNKRIDLILTRGTRGVGWARVVGDEPFVSPDVDVDGPRYAADHAGVVAKVRLKRP